eukprot:361500-Chlamydomonas_euryale.AAC.4
MGDPRAPLGSSRCRSQRRRTLPGVSAGAPYLHRHGSLHVLHLLRRDAARRAHWAAHATAGAVAAGARVHGSCSLDFGARRRRGHSTRHARKGCGAGEREASESARRKEAAGGTSVLEAAAAGKCRMCVEGRLGRDARRVHTDPLSHPAKSHTQPSSSGTCEHGRMSCRATPARDGETGARMPAGAHRAAAAAAAAARSTPPPSAPLAHVGTPSGAGKRGGEGEAAFLFFPNARTAPARWPGRTLCSREEAGWEKGRAAGHHAPAAAAALA